ncbi:MAG TPA: thiol-disulfide oxidoreductase DCC family protein [Chitinophagaceae bacterium]|nr:thiol-disulfide oxidoreductase DCC family protein [Chitinophagaceae bacterium]
MQQQSVLFFDGVCNLCNGAVNFIIAQDKKAVFQFAPLQSEAAQQLLQPYGDFKKLDSVVLLADGQLFQKSIAALKVLKFLPWYWQWMQVFWIVPRVLRDAIYDFIARNRYRWFGKKAVCMLPSPEVKNRFLN